MQVDAGRDGNQRYVTRIFRQARSTARRAAHCARIHPKSPRR